MTVGELIVKIGADIKEYQKKIEEVQKKNKKLYDTFNKVGNASIVAGTAMLSGVGLMVKTATEYNQKMAEVSTLLGGAIEKTKKYKEATKKLAESVGKDFSDMAGGLYQVISAFGETDNTLKILEIAAKDATAGVASTTDAINLLSAVSKGYNDTSTEMIQKVSDLSFLTVKLGQTTFPELASTIGKVVPIASSLNISVEELYAGFATLTGVTGSTADVATQLRSAMVSLLNPTEDMSDAIHSLGYESGEAMVKSLGFGGTLQALAKYAEENDIPLAKLFGRVEAVTAALAVAGPQSEDYAKKLEAMKKSAGSTDEAFKAMTEGINKTGFTVQQAKVEFMNLVDALSASVLPYIKQLFNVIKNLIDWFDKLSPAIKDVIGPMMMFGGLGLIVAGGIMKIIGPLTQIIGLLPAVASGFMTIQAAGGPILWIIEAIAAAVALLYLAWKNNWGGIRDKTQEVIEFLKPYITTAWNVIKTTILTTVRIIHDVVTGDWEDLKNVAQTIWNGIKDFIIAAWNSIKEKSAEIWNGIIAGIQNLWTSIQTTISGWGESLVNLGHEIVGKLVTGIANAYEGFRSVVSELWSIIWTVINTWWENLINFGHEIVGKIATGIANKYKGFRKVVNELWEIIKTVFNNAWSGLLGIGRRIVEGIWSGIKGATGWILGKLKSWVGDVLGWLKKMFGIGSPSKITTEYGKFLGLGLVEGIEKTIPDVARAIDSMINLTKGFSVEPSLAANAGFSNVPKTTTFNLSVNVNVENMSGDEQDIYELSRKVAEEIRKEIMIYQFQEA